MLVLISPKNLKEAIEAKNGGADIIDVKNPEEGSLGASFPWIIKEISESVKPTLISAAIGDMIYKPGTAALAAYTASIWADYIKVGLIVKTTKQAMELSKAFVKSVKENEKNAVIASYADYYRSETLSPFEVVEVAATSEADVVMVDTLGKDLTLFDYMDVQSVAEFVDSAHEHGLMCAIAGSIGIKDIPLIKSVKPDIIGVRGAVCEGGRNGKLKRELVEEFVKAVKS